MLKIKRKKPMEYDFKFKIYWKDGKQTEGEITNSGFEPVDIFLTGKMTYFGNKCVYYNLDAIKCIEITNLVEKVGDE